MELVAIILAAGDGKRMHSALPKSLHALGGKPMLAWVSEALAEAGATGQIIVIPKDAPSLTDFINAHKAEQPKLDLKTAIQAKHLGTGNAVMTAQNALKDFNGTAIIACGDTPLLEANTLKQLTEQHRKSKATITILASQPQDPSGYGRLITSKNQITQIIEEKDATSKQKTITLVNSGVMALELPLAFDLLGEIKADNKQQEQYLTDIVAIAHKRKLKTAYIETDHLQTFGINDRKALAQAESLLQNRLRQNAMESGATLIAPETIFLHHDTILEQDIIIEPHVVIGAGCHIGSGSVIKSFSYLEGIRCGNCCVIGPYARLRGGTELSEGVKIGNFVETKNATIGANAKANHLSYIGDAEVGSEANIGAGTITCNFDGISKHHTSIGKGAFIGSNTALVAPVSVGKGAVIGAGSVITSDVAADAIAVGRAPATVSEGGALRFKQTRQKNKK